jgi:hypothetical protein
LAAIAVFITLVYLARQVKQGNVLARYQARQAMMEQDLATLQLQIENVGIPLVFTNENASREDLMKLHLFLTRILRQREWEWFQYRDGIIDEGVYKTYHEVIAIFLATPVTQNWWNTIGRMGMNPGFVEDVDALLSDRGHTEYWERAREFHG